MGDNRYGGLLDKPMKNDTTAMDAVNRFRDAVNKQRQEEIDKVNRLQSERMQKELAEQERQAKQNDFINSMLEKSQQRASAEARKKEAAEREQARREQSRKAMENLNWTPKKISR